MKTIVIYLVKDRTGDISDKGNFKPISLVTIVAKVLRIVGNHLSSCTKLDDVQFGFTWGHEWYPEDDRRKNGLGCLP